MNGVATMQLELMLKRVLEDRERRRGSRYMPHVRARLETALRRDLQVAFAIYSDGWAYARKIDAERQRGMAC